MKIGIITIQKCDNYGADLQAYALGTKLRLSGYDAENIDYLFYKHPRHKSDSMEKPVLPISIVNKVKEVFFPIVNNLRSHKNADAMKERAKQFAAWQENIKCGKEYPSVDSLYVDPPRYDVYMVGSDQVWNPRMYSNIKPYFLDFASKDARCVSYAASFGVSMLAGEVFYMYKQWLRRFSHIGLREAKGAEWVNAMSLDAEVKHVVDPTLLLNSDEWLQVAVEPKNVVPSSLHLIFSQNSDYLLLYDLISCADTVNEAMRIAKERGLRIVRVDDGAYGPGEFLWLFAHATIVVTNSFHGTVFSILNHKPFVTVIPKMMANTSRIDSLLAVVNIGYDNSNIQDWTHVDNRLETARGESLDFLKRAIEGHAQKVDHRLPIGCYGFLSGDENIRADSTSGGIFTSLASVVIQRGGIVFGAAFVDGFHRVAHIAAESICDLSSIRKSKYVWSDPTGAYKKTVEYVAADRLVMFTGTPCQCAAIRKLVGDNDKLITVDFACHGTPRSEYFDSYITELEKTYQSKVISYEYRNKDHGWNFPHIIAKFENGKVYDAILLRDPYYLGFGVNATLREACFKCPYVGIERGSDITIGDCWRVGVSHPDMDDNRGTSMVLVNTERGKILFDTIRKKEPTSRWFDYELDLAQARNMPLMQKVLKPLCYNSFIECFKATGSYAEASKIFISKKIILKAAIVYFVKKIGWFYFKRIQ